MFRTPGEALLMSYIGYDFFLIIQFVRPKTER